MVKSQSWTDGNLKNAASISSGGSLSNPASPWHRVPSASDVRGGGGGGGGASSRIRTSKSDHSALGISKKDSLIDLGDEDQLRRRKEAESKLTRVRHRCLRDIILRFVIFSGLLNVAKSYGGGAASFNQNLPLQVSVLEAFDPLLMGDASDAPVQHQQQHPAGKEGAHNVDK